MLISLRLRVSIIFSGAYPVSEAQFVSINPEQFSELLQRVGLRAEMFDVASDVPHIKSSTGGLGFSVRFGNRAQPPAEGFLDFSYIAVIKIDGEFKLEKCNEWNRQRRFTRLHRADDLLIMDMDVMIGGGVTEKHILGSLEIWDRLTQELILWLRGQGAGAANAA
jgi:hypothetical protein